MRNNQFAARLYLPLYKLSIFFLFLMTQPETVTAVILNCTQTCTKRHGAPSVCSVNMEWLVNGVYIKNKCSVEYPSVTAFCKLADTLLEIANVGLDAVSNINVPSGIQGSPSCFSSSNGFDTSGYADKIRHTSAILFPTNNALIVLVVILITAAAFGLLHCSNNSRQVRPRFFTDPTSTPLTTHQPALASIATRDDTSGSSDNSAQEFKRRPGTSD